MESSPVSVISCIGWRVLDLNLFSYPDDWAMRPFLHPKLLRKAREVRTQLEDIMKFQKMDLISAETDFDIIRLAHALHFSSTALTICSAKQSPPDTFIKQLG